MRTHERLSRHAALLAGCSVLLFGGVHAAVADENAKAAAATEATNRFNIPAQDLSAALTLFGQQSDREIVFSPEATRAKNAPAVMGEMPSLRALAAILSRSGLTYRVTNDGTIVVLTPKEAEKFTSAPSTAALSLAQVQTEKSKPADSYAMPSSESPAKDADSSSSKGMQEIIVTAAKRAQNIQDVPMSITAITADEIERRGLVSSQDYLRGIPGVNQVGDGGTYGGQAIVIRGVETSLQSQNFSSGPTVATYFGETPTTATAGLLGSGIDIKLVDIERVEVLRGPQGTAFGSASMGGVVRSIPVAPKLDRLDAKVGAGYSTTSGTGGQNYNVQAIGNLPLVGGKIAVRAVAYDYHDAGFYRNRAGSDADFIARAVTPYGGEAFAVDKNRIGDVESFGGRLSALFQVTDALSFTASYLRQKTQGDDMPVATSGTYEQTVLEVAPEHRYRGQKGGLNDTDIEIANGTLQYDLGWADLFATYSNVSAANLWAIPFSSFGLDVPGSSGGPVSHHENNGEVRLSTKLNGAWNVLVGAYAEKIHDLYNYTVRWHGTPGADIFGAGQDLLFQYQDKRALEQQAGFGEVSWEFAPRFTLTGGVRAYRYDRTVGIVQSGPLAGNVTTAESHSIKTSGENFRANLSYKPVENALLYAGWSQGFRIGKPQPGVPPGICDRDSDGIIDGTNVTIESTRSLGPDSVDNYEVGGKFSLLDRRVSITAAVFRMNWTDIPVAVRYASCDYLQSVNAGEARSQGVEFQANLRVSDKVSVDVGGSVINAKLTEDVPAQGFKAGSRLPGSPKINASLGLQRDFQLGAHAASVRADAIYVSNFFGDILESANSEAGEYVKLDASARVEFGSLHLDLFARNITNEDSFSLRTGGANPLLGYRLRPRTIGLQLGYSF